MKLRRRQKRTKDQALDAVASVTRTWSDWQLSKRAGKGVAKAKKLRPPSKVKAVSGSKWFRIGGVVAVVGGAGAAIAAKLKGSGAEPVYTPPAPSEPVAAPPPPPVPPIVPGGLPVAVVPEPVQEAVAAEPAADPEPAVEAVADEPAAEEAAGDPEPAEESAAEEPATAEGEPADDDAAEIEADEAASGDAEK